MNALFMENKRAGYFTKNEEYNGAIYTQKQ